MPTHREPIIPPGGEARYERFQFAPAYRVGDTIYVSGVIGVDADGHVPKSVDEEYAAAFTELAAVLEFAGSSLADIVELTSFHTDLAGTLGAFMAAKAAVMTAPYPAWTAIGCTSLAIPAATVEVRATAVQ
ncbi:MAG: Rid family hydrolase [Ilumatobacteraceae bacterium]